MAAQAVTKIDVHDIMSKLPVGIAVQNPDGNLGYGAPAVQQASYVPPADASYAPPTRQQIDSSVHV